jgi:hypothetical protein
MMTFRDYRAKGTIRAAEITEESIELQTANDPDAGIRPYGKGDYAELREGKLLGWTKVAFEAAYGPTYKRQSRAKKTRKAKSAPPALATNGESA